jgi:hypothetical protein
MGPAPGPGYSEVVPLNQVLDKLPGEAPSSAITGLTNGVVTAPSQILDLPAKASSSVLPGAAKGVLNFGVHLGVGLVTNWIATKIVSGSDVPMSPKDIEMGSTLLSGLPPGVDIAAAVAARGVTAVMIDMYKQGMQHSYENFKEQNPDATPFTQSQMDTAAAPIMGDAITF